MSTKIVKSAKLLGLANESGTSFPSGDYLAKSKEAYDRAQIKAKAIEGITTGPARVYIVVEQDVIVND